MDDDHLSASDASNSNGDSNLPLFAANGETEPISLLPSTPVTLLLRTFLFVHLLVGFILLVVPSIAQTHLPSGLTDPRTQGCLYLATTALTVANGPITRQSFDFSTPRGVAILFSCTITLCNLLRRVIAGPGQLSSWVWITFYIVWLFALAWHSKRIVLPSCP